MQKMAVKQVWPITVLMTMLGVPLAIAGQQEQKHLTTHTRVSQGEHAQVPSLPALNHNPKRDASPAADAATKAQIKSKLDLQIAAARKNPALSHVTMVRPSVVPPREIAALQRQKTYLETLRKQGVLAPFRTPNGQLGANSRAMGSVPQGPVPSPVVAPQTITPTGSLLTTSGGPLLLSPGTSQGNLRTVAPPLTAATVGAPAMRQAPSSAAQHQTLPNNSTGAYASAANAPRVTIAAGSVSGYVLWDTSTVHYQLSSPCQGLQVTVSSNSADGLHALASSTSFTAPFGIQPVWNFSGKGSQGPWMVCAYVFHQMPERVPLEVHAVVTQPSAFASPVGFTVQPTSAQKTQLQIPGGNCGTTPDSTLATVLNSGPALCGDYAFNVNFAGLNGRLNASLTNSKVCFGTQIYTVNGVDRAENAENPVVFTQDPAYNDYIITGCGFGSGEGKQQVYLSGAVTGGRINMTILQWSPTQIEAVVQWGLTGVLDGWPDLNVVPANGGASAKFSNCRFYAQRQTVLLPGVPQQYVRLASEQVGDSTHGFGTNYCPGPDLTHLFPCVAFNGGYPLDGVSNGDSSVKSGPSTNVTNAVDRDGGQLKFSPGQDTYDLSDLAPGFVIDGIPVAHWYYWSESVCEMWAAEDSEKPGDGINWDPAPASQYNLTQTGTQITVSWGVDHCAWRWLGIFNVDDEYNAGYSLEVHVTGPIGVDPWAGHATGQ